MPIIGNAHHEMSSVWADAVGLGAAGGVAVLRGGAGQYTGKHESH